MLILTGKNFELYAMQNYINSKCVDYSEFKDDLARVRYVRRLLTRYITTDNLRLVIIRNHIIVLVNVFGVTGALTLLFYKIEPELYNILYTILSVMYNIPNSINGMDISNLEVDANVLKLIGLN